MSIRAEVYRVRAATVRRLYAASDDGAIATAAGIARSYEALAQTEEWLDGEVPPCAVTPPSRASHSGRSGDPDATSPLQKGRSRRCAGS